MMTVADLRHNHEVIKEFCTRYRTELTVFGGFYGEWFDGNTINHKEYIEFMNDVSIDTFVGNYYFGLTNKVVIETYQKVLDGELDIYDFLKTTAPYVEEIIQQVKEYLEVKEES